MSRQRQRTYPCGYKGISKKTGKPIHGIAAMLQQMHEDGGPDEHIKKIATRAAAYAVHEAQAEGRKPKLKLVR